MADEMECQIVPVTFTQVVSPIETSYEESPKQEDWDLQGGHSEHGTSMRQVQPERQLLEEWACWQVGNREGLLVQSLSRVFELARALGMPVEEREARHRRLRARCDLYVRSFHPGYGYCMDREEINLENYLWKKVPSRMTSIYMAINWLV